MSEGRARRRQRGSCGSASHEEARSQQPAATTSAAVSPSRPLELTSEPMLMAGAAALAAAGAAAFAAAAAAAGTIFLMADMRARCVCAGGSVVAAARVRFAAVAAAVASLCWCLSRVCCTSEPFFHSSLDRPEGVSWVSGEKRGRIE